MANVVTVTCEGDRWYWLAIDRSGNPQAGCSWDEDDARVQAANCDHPGPGGWISGGSYNYSFPG